MLLIEGQRAPALGSAANFFQHLFFIAIHQKYRMANPAKTTLSVLYVAVITLVVVAADYASGQEDNAFLVNSNQAYLHNCGDSDSHCKPSINLIDEECPCDRIAHIPIDTEVIVQCRVKGEKVAKDPWWLYVYVPSVDEFGWIADYYVECGPRICPGSRC